MFVPSPSKFSLPSTTLAVTPVILAAFTAAANCATVVSDPPNETVDPLIEIPWLLVSVGLAAVPVTVGQLDTQAADPTFTHAPEVFL